MEEEDVVDLRLEESEDEEVLARFLFLDGMLWCEVVSGSGSGSGGRCITQMILCVFVVLCFVRLCDDGVCFLNN